LTAQRDFRPLTRSEIAKRLAHDIPDGSYVNLGIGIPTLVADHVVAEREIVFHSENGVMGVGPAPAEGEEDPDLINASKHLVTLRAGASFMSHSDSFALIRGGRLDFSVLGAFEVSSGGDLANWAAPGALVPAVGGAMDLAVGARRVWITMNHTTKEGAPRLVERCTYPLTASGVVERVYTDLAVLEVSRSAKQFIVLDIVPGMSFSELEARTGAALSRP
jgi:3-oxoadipate CoA-transferase beta subunit